MDKKNFSGKQGLARLKTVLARGAYGSASQNVLQPETSVYGRMRLFAVESPVWKEPVFVRVGLNDNYLHHVYYPINFPPKRGHVQAVIDYLETGTDKTAKALRLFNGFVRFNQKMWGFAQGEIRKPGQLLPVLAEVTAGDSGLTVPSGIYRNRAGGLRRFGDLWSSDSNGV